MTIRSAASGVLLVALVAAACGGSVPASDETPRTDAATISVTTSPPGPASSEEAPATTAPPPTAAAPSPEAETPAVAALSSGRGDDGSLEVGIWFTSNPFAGGDARVLVGVDSDDSFPGAGSPIDHIDGWAEIRSDQVTLFDAGVIVAGDDQGDLGEWLSWTGPGRSGFVYFFGNVPVRAGTVWVIVEVDGEIASGAVAGTPFGTGCSFRGAGVDLGNGASDAPDPGAPCRYPLG